MTGVSTNYGVYVPPTSTSGSSGTNGTSGNAPVEEGLFSSPTTAQSEAEAAAKASKKQSLEAELAKYQAQKQQLEEQLRQYNVHFSQLEKKDNVLKAKEKALTGEIADLEELRKQEEQSAKELKDKYDTDNTKLLNVIKQMNEKIAETTQKSAEAVQEQNKKTEAATQEAFKMYEEGKITEDEIPNYIASKSGNSDMAKQIALAGLGIIESFSSQVKGLISQMANALNTLNDKKIKIDAATTKIKSTNQELGTIQNERLAVEDEMRDVQGSINSTNQQIAGVDQNITVTQGSISALDEPVAGVDAPPTGEVPPSGEAPQSPTAEAPASTPPANPFSTGGGKSERESTVVTTSIGDAIDNPFCSVTSTIDYTGFKSMLDVLMEQNQTSINNMRRALAQDQEGSKVA